MSPQVHLWATAGLVLAVSSLHAAPPLGCIENAQGARLCESYAHKKIAPEPIEKPVLVASQHPAFAVLPPQPFQPIGQVIKSLPIEKFLPSYFEPRAIPITKTEENK